MADVPEAEIGPNDVLIKIRQTAICGTDVHIYKWDDWAQRTIPVPMVVGHEFVGEVAEIGSHVKGFSVGDRVSGEGHITCGYCRNCKAGRRHCVAIRKVLASTEPELLLSTWLFRPSMHFLPDDVPDEIAAFFDPLETPFTRHCPSTWSEKMC